MFTIDFVYSTYLDINSTIDLIIITDVVITEAITNEAITIKFITLDFILFISYSLICFIIIKIPYLSF